MISQYVTTAPANPPFVTLWKAYSTGINLPPTTVRAGSINKPISLFQGKTFTSQCSLGFNDTTARRVSTSANIGYEFWWRIVAILGF